MAHHTGLACSRIFATWKLRPAWLLDVKSCLPGPGWPTLFEIFDMYTRLYSLSPWTVGGIYRTLVLHHRISKVELYAQLSTRQETYHFTTPKFIDLNVHHRNRVRPTCKVHMLSTPVADVAEMSHCRRCFQL
jgi:hypothetical protein